MCVCAAYSITMFHPGMLQPPFRVPLNYAGARARASQFYRMKSKNVILMLYVLAMRTRSPSSHTCSCIGSARTISTQINHVCRAPFLTVLRAQIRLWPPDLVPPARLKVSANKCTDLFEIAHITAGFAKRHVFRIYDMFV